MCVGILLHRFAEVDELRLRGRGAVDAGLKLLGLLFVGGAMALAGAPMLGVFLGKSLGEGAVEASGYGWAIAVFILASGMTAGAVLRAAGTIFAGWGEDEPPESEQPQEQDEERETLKPHDRTPLTMLIPTLALTLAALAIGFLPGLDHAVEQAAARFTDAPAYAGAVLHGRGAFESIEPKGLKAVDFLWSGLSLALALAVAAVSLFGGRLEMAALAPLRRRAEAGLELLGTIHSGHVGDYVAWMTAAAGGLAVAVGLIVR
jgi:multicomponent Na+:H+ antiporter subunit D